MILTAKQIIRLEVHEKPDEILSDWDLLNGRLRQLLRKHSLYSPQRLILMVPVIWRRISRISLCQVRYNRGDDPFNVWNSTFEWSEAQMNDSPNWSLWGDCLRLLSLIEIRAQYKDNMNNILEFGHRCTIPPMPLLYNHKPFHTRLLKNTWLWTFRYQISYRSWASSVDGRNCLNS